MPTNYRTQSHPIISAAAAITRVSGRPNHRVFAMR